MKSSKRTKQSASSIRVIGGQWRSRRIVFRTDPAIRPTPDRIRETLFNWLQNSISDASCLELFAGTGALSIEALSRGADHVTIVDQSAAIIGSIRSNLEVLCEDEARYDCIEADAVNWIQHQEGRAWDIIFLDPPFDSDSLTTILPIIADQRLLQPDGHIYIESPKSLDSSELPPGWEIARKKQASNVHYCLCRNG